ncbi:class I SAM-dependent methyltransferase [Acidisoma cellulosilytica]|uniref:Class I SAM-dependent methyltransferase n=1 Tax=Acidisoma cellulosilyticum TaxID=2802395 RepID=A0A964E4S9_9PROT|nr:class I SAM-dependent methyltransferase [Acidisoma cellulosilyticum]MCB8881806.1 class I SAM-dependent methyltransferase [Acidisoma cellulosilyticum]
MTDSTDAQLAAQYEAYPYPARDPKEEAKRLIIGSPSHLREIDYWVFGARRPQAQPLQALVAGGGTGDGTIMLATHLSRRGNAGRVTYLDRSLAAMRIARARAEARNLTNIDWVQGSILDLPTLGLGPFDYIDCCGVLHHLPEPAAGLAALEVVLAPGGGMGLMVYAPHGRTGVYMVQDALALLAPPDQTPAARIEVGKRVMRHLPESNWLRFNRNFSDHISGGDAGLYDLLLNPRDRAFTVSDFAALLGTSGMAVAAFMEPMRYNPATWLPDPKLRARAASLSATAQAALAESLTGNMSVHIAYCRRAAEPVTRADPMADTAVPVMREVPGSELVKSILPNGQLPFLFDGLRAPVSLPPQAPAILQAIDGERTVADLAAFFAERGMAADKFRRAWAEVFAALEPVNRVLLAAPKG